MVWNFSVSEWDALSCPIVYASWRKLKYLITWLHRCTLFMYYELFIAFDLRSQSIRFPSERTDTYIVYSLINYVVYHKKITLPLLEDECRILTINIV